MSCLMSFLYWQINISYIIPRVSEFKICVTVFHTVNISLSKILTIDLRRGACEERTTTAYLGVIYFKKKWRKGHRKYTNKLHTFVT